MTLPARTAITLPTTLVLALLVAGLVLTARPAAAQNGGPRPTSYILPGDQVFPEGIAFQPGTGDFFVSSTTDGTIFRGNVKEPVASVFLPGGADERTTAIGLEVDAEGRLYVAGGGTGRLFVYDTGTGELLAAFSNGTSPTFVNDVAVTRQGDAYFTDSSSPFLYRVYSDASGDLAFEKWIDFTGTALQYQPGFNLNGIEATPDGRYLIVVQSNTGGLFRVDTLTREVAPIDLGGATLTMGDGLWLQSHRLYVMRNALGLLEEVRLSGDYTRGRVVSSTADPSFAYPTTLVQARGRLLVVNSQFDKRGPGLTPDLPFTVSSIRVP